MIEYRITTHNDKILNEFGKDNWQLIQILDGKMYWSRVIKKVVKRKPKEETKEFKEFITAYRKLNVNGSYADNLPGKYTEALKIKDHKFIMDKLQEYTKHLDAFTFKSPVQAGVFINQKRFLEDYEVANVDYVNKWKSDMLKEQGIDQMYIDAIMAESEKWESTHGKSKEMTNTIFQNIIDRYTKG